MHSGGGRESPLAQLTKRENASLYSETCSSVNESALKVTRSAMRTISSRITVRIAPQSGGFFLIFFKMTGTGRRGVHTMVVVVGMRK